VFSTPNQTRRPAVSFAAPELPRANVYNKRDGRSPRAQWPSSRAAPAKTMRPSSTFRALNPRGGSVAAKYLPREQPLARGSRCRIAKGHLDLARAMAQSHAHHAIRLAQIEHCSAQANSRILPHAPVFSGAARPVHPSARPVLATRPLSSAITRSPSASTSSRLCVTYRIGIPFGCIPRAQIVDNGCFQLRIQSRQWLVEQQHARLRSPVIWPARFSASRLQKSCPAFVSAISPRERLLELLLLVSRLSSFRRSVNPYATFSSALRCGNSARV